VVGEVQSRTKNIRLGGTVGLSPGGLLLPVLGDHEIISEKQTNEREKTDGGGAKGRRTQGKPTIRPTGRKGPGGERNKKKKGSGTRPGGLTGTGPLS